MDRDNTSLLGRVDEVIKHDSDPVLRNLLITQAYFQLSLGLSRVLGVENANWCSFAVWASKTAGSFVRKEAAPELVRRLLGVQAGDSGDRESLPPVSLDVFGPPSNTEISLLELPDRIFREVSRLIARGNLIVFTELAPIFRRMIELYEGRGRPEASWLEELLAPMKPGPTTEGGQGLFRDALTHYHNALLTDDPDTKAELILFGNARVGLHEQIRLQPYIAGSLNSPVKRLVRSFGGPKLKLPKPFQAAFEGLIRPATDRVASLWRELATRDLMRLKLPNGDLVLGQDLPVQPGQPLYPEYLRTIEDDELHVLLAEYGAHDSTSYGSGSNDWAYLPSRMGYILELYRSRQCDPNLFAPPFRETDERQILSWRVPVSNDL